MPTPPGAEPAIPRDIRGVSQARHPDGVISSLAERQHGVVARRQLIEKGMSEDAIDRRTDRGALHRLHAGVYAVGQRQLRQEGWWMAAVLAGGGDAVLSHRSAAVLWAIRRPESGRKVEISTPGSMRPAGGVLRHEIRHMKGETTRRRWIPVTTLRRTIVDLAASLSVEALEAAVREAQYRHSLDDRSLGRLPLEYRGRRGIARLRECLENLEVGPRGRTRSTLEDEVASLLARTDIRQPEFNVLVDIGGGLIEADCIWRKEKVIIELDGREEHSTAAAFQSDRARDRRLQAHGWKVGRVTRAHMRRPETVLADISGMLEAGSAERS